MGHSIARFIRGKKKSSSLGGFKALRAVLRQPKKGIAGIIPGLVRINRPTGGIRGIAERIAGVGKRKRTGGGTPGISGTLGASESSSGSGTKKKLG